MKDILIHRMPHEMIGIAKSEFQERVWTTKDGVVCPVCARSGKVYRMALSKVQVKMLGWLAQYTKRGEYIHFNKTAPRAFVKSVSIGKTKHWGLIDQKPNDDLKKKGSGYIMITDAGRAFILNQLKVHRHIFLYQDRVLQSGGGEVCRQDLHPEDFNFSKLMQPARPT
jgi:hypothetical protein